MQQGFLIVHINFTSRTIDLLDWNSLIDDTTQISNLLMVPNLEVSCCAQTLKGAVGRILDNVQCSSFTLSCALKQIRTQNTKQC